MIKIKTAYVLFHDVYLIVFKRGGLNIGYRNYWAVTLFN